MRGGAGRSFITEQLTRNEQVSGWSPLVGSLYSAYLGRICQAEEASDAPLGAMRHHSDTTAARIRRLARIPRKRCSRRVAICGEVPAYWRNFLRTRKR